MISLLITLGAVAEAKSQFGPGYGYELPALGTALPEPSGATGPKPWLLPNLRFDDSQDCLTLIEKQVEGFGTLRVSQRCPGRSGQPAPWRPL